MAIGRIFSFPLSRAINLDERNSGFRESGREPDTNRDNTKVKAVTVSGEERQGNKISLVHPLIPGADPVRELIMTLRTSYSSNSIGTTSEGPGGSALVQSGWRR